MTTPSDNQTNPDVVDLPLEQHDEIKSLFSEVPQVQGPAKRELFEDLVRLLAVHETAEETVVHPVARNKLADGEQVTKQRLYEEDEAKKTLAELHDLGVDHPDFDRRLEAFAAEVVEHATKEESEEFLLLRGVLDGDRLRRMARALQAAEAAAPTLTRGVGPDDGRAGSACPGT